MCTLARYNPCLWTGPRSCLIRLLLPGLYDAPDIEVGGVRRHGLDERGDVAEKGEGLLVQVCVGGTKRAFSTSVSSRDAVAAVDAALAQAGPVGGDLAERRRVR